MKRWVEDGVNGPLIGEGVVAAYDQQLAIAIEMLRKAKGSFFVVVDGAPPRVVSCVVERRRDDFLDSVAGALAGLHDAPKGDE